MSIRISTRSVQGVVVIDMFGQLKLGEGTSRLRETVRQLLSEGYTKILLNFENVLHVDSTGIGELMGCYTSVKSQGGEMKLLHLSKNVRNVLQVTRLYSVFDVREDLATAVRAYN